MNNKPKTRFTKPEVVSRTKTIVQSIYRGQRVKVQIGERTNQKEHVFKTQPTREEYWSFYESSHADLADSVDLRASEITDELREFGTVIHVYVNTYSWGEFDLDDILTIWLGTETEQPVLLGGGR